MELTARIARLLEEKYASDETFADCFTVEIELKPGNKLYVFADSDSGMTFEKCKSISRFLESHLDANGWLTDKYVLEVSSPGIGRALKFVRQYARNIGRTVEIIRLDKTSQTGVLKFADDEKAVIEHEIVELEGKKKVKKMVDVEIPMSTIDKTIVKISF